MRTQPPERNGAPVTFKPGTSTWATDDPSQAPPWVRAQVPSPAPMPRRRTACDMPIRHNKVMCRTILLTVAACIAVDCPLAVDVHDRQQGTRHHLNRNLRL